MGSITIKRWQCDRCKIVHDGDRPYRKWEGSARYRVLVDVDYGTAGGIEIDWKEMCDECNQQVGPLLKALRKEP